jgi:hypothetical protein
MDGHRCAYRGVEHCLVTRIVHEQGSRKELRCAGHLNHAEEHPALERRAGLQTADHCRVVRRKRRDWRDARRDAGDRNENAGEGRREDIVIADPR